MRYPDLLVVRRRRGEREGGEKGWEGKDVKE